MATKIYCAAIDCEYNNSKNVCTAKDVSLSDHYVMTVWEGRQRFNRCKAYKESSFSREIREKLEQIMKK